MDFPLQVKNKKIQPNPNLLLFENTLKKYREALILFYVSIRNENWESAFSLLPIMNAYQNQLNQFFITRKIFKKMQNNKNMYSEFYHLINKISFLSNKIEYIFNIKRHKIKKHLDKNLYIKIDFLIKNFLQEKGI